MNLKFVLAAGAMLAASPAMAASVVDGSFETPVVQSVSYGVGGPVVLSPGAGFEPNGGAFGYAAAPDGNQVLHLQGTSTATLSLIDLVAGQSYAISFLASARPGYNNLPVDVSVDGASLGQISPTVTSFVAYTGFRFVAAGSTGSLTFTGVPADGSDTNTAIDFVTIAAVPEPATWALMIGGFGLVGGAMRRRTKAMTFA